MTLSSRKEYLGEMRERYRHLKTKKEKSQIILAVSEFLKIHRKHAIRVLNEDIFVKKLKRKPRKRKYEDDLITPLKLVWVTLGYPCSQRLVTQIPTIIKILKSFGEITITQKQQELLSLISSDTIDRLLTHERKKLLGKGLSGTRRSPLLRTLIPIRTEFGDVNAPGHLETDCVLHCGDSLSGIYAETVNMLDIYTHWNEKRMIMDKTKAKVVGAFHKAREYFPFPILSNDFDNGHEFVNWSMYGYCRREGIKFTRSRSYHKNDQAHIEGKNYQSVRRVTGYGRITNQQIVDAFNDLYEKEHRVLTNFFYPTLKLKKKKKIGGKYHKKYEKAKTPYKRVMESKMVSKEIKTKLKLQYENLNPAALQRSMAVKISKIKTMISVT